MGLLADKILPLFVYPLGLAILAGIATVILSWIGFLRTSRLVLLAAVALLWTTSTPLFANWLAATLEAKYPPVAIDDLPDADVAIVLGGAIRQPVPPRVEPDANQSIDRVLLTARLFLSGKVGAILVTGGNLPWTAAIKPEAELIGDLLVDLGVPREAIVFDADSRNTRENALNSAARLQEHRWRSVLLVTSGTHMPRAVATFERAGIAATPVSTDIRSSNVLAVSLINLLPDAEALHESTSALKEYLGGLVYRLRGWA